MMNTWKITEQGYDPERTVMNGNRFLIANGYMGIRGTVEEAGIQACPAINLAGVYDRFEDRWREPVNAPHPLFLRLWVEGNPMQLGEKPHSEHSLTLDYRKGIFERDTDFGPVRLRTRRIASLKRCHLAACEVILEAQSDCIVEMETGICTRVWDINGPHLFSHEMQPEQTLKVLAVTGEKKIPVAVAQCVSCADVSQQSRQVRSDGVFRNLQIALSAQKPVKIEIFGAVYTGLDTDGPCAAAEKEAELACAEGFASVLAEHEKEWERVWEASAVEIEGNEEAALAVHASQFYLNSIAPRHGGALSIPARGLSGQTYKGAIFWDSEIFLFPMFVYTQPEVARSLLRYRIETLNGARKKAAEYGYRGAFYAWESQEGGAEGCTDFNVVDVFTHRPVRTYFRDKQIHISADIAVTLRRYYEITGDRSLLEEGGAEVILECARFFLSRCSGHMDSEQLDLTDVIGPDEYHERVTNNAFTNRMARCTIRTAMDLKDIFADRPEYLEELIDRLGYRRDWALLADFEKNLRGPKERDGIVEQFDGYFRLEDPGLSVVRSRLMDPREYWGGDHGVAGPTQVIKQADVIALMALFPEEYSAETVAANWNYYEPRTEHGSSLSACMYALTACRIGKPDQAWDLFLRSAQIDLIGGGKQWAGEVYIGGTHPASNGGTWMIAALGFAGLTSHMGTAELHPHLPEGITELSFPLQLSGKRMTARVTREGWSLTER